MTISTALFGSQHEPHGLREPVVAGGFSTADIRGVVSRLRTFHTMFHSVTVDQRKRSLDGLSERSIASIGSDPARKNPALGEP
jgi:hypothetical protein